jgi:2-amino-4-hydroxy-6-hydroxymethyldihydropteridine diphosphokinase
MILIALGANLNSLAGTPEKTLVSALAALEGCGVECTPVSSFYRTPAWPDPADPPFVNAVAGVKTLMPPEDLMRTLHEIENRFGRTRPAKNAPRTLDLDLLDYRGVTRNGDLVLPHPRLAERAFVMIPLCEIAPSWRHPASGRTAAELLAALPEMERMQIVKIAP